MTEDKSLITDFYSHNVLSNANTYTEQAINSFYFSSFTSKIKLGKSDAL